MWGEGVGGHGRISHCTTSGVYERPCLHLPPAVFDDLGGDTQVVSVGGVMADIEEKLFDAVRAGDVPVMKRLIERGGADVNQRYRNEMTLLHYASAEGQLEAARTLAELGADVNSQDPNGTTPLHYAAHEGHADVVTALVELGAVGDRRQ